MHRRLLALPALVCLLVLGVPGAAEASGTGVIRGTGKVSVRSAPGGKVMGKLRGGRRIRISCQLNGPAANGSGGRSAIWDRIRYGRRVGFVTDAVVDTGDTAGLVAKYCGAPGASKARVTQTSGSCSITSPVPLDDPFADHDSFLQAAIPGAQASDSETQVPASVTLAQAILESGWGQFSAGANNYFGMKAQATQQVGVYDWGTLGAGCVLRRTQEEVGGRLQYEIAAFRAYSGLKDSIRDHGARLLANPVYAPAFKYPDDSERFARSIAKHYATDSRYADKLVSIMRRYDLEQYDVPGDGQPAPSDGGASSSSGGLQG